MSAQFDDVVFTDLNVCLRVAQKTADANGSPVAILERHGVYAVIEEPPDDAECDPFGNGWTAVALIDPFTADVWKAE